MNNKKSTAAPTRDNTEYTQRGQGKAAIDAGESYAALPQAVKECRFCCWKRTNRNGRTTKVPYNPLTGGKAMTDRPETFGAFEDAIAAFRSGGFDGIGILIDSVAAFDIDHCIDKNGNLNDLATSVLGIFKDCYVEVSPSGTGLRGLFRVEPGFSYDRNIYYIKHGDLELYLPGMTNRFVTVTGDVYRDGEAADCTDAVKVLLDTHMKRDSMNTSLPADFEPHSYLTDDEVLYKARKDVKFSACFDGDWTDHFPSQSEADLYVLGMLAFYCGGDQDQMERVFSTSALNRDKFCDESGLTAYGKNTIRMAVAGRNSFYDPDHIRTSAAEDFAELDEGLTGADSPDTESDEENSVETEDTAAAFAARLASLIASSPDAGALYQRPNILLAAYAKEERPADYEKIRQIAIKNHMSLRRYEKEIKSVEDEVKRRREERQKQQAIKAAEREYGKPMPDFIYFNAMTGCLGVDPARLAVHVKKNLTFILVEDSLRDTRTKYVYEDGVYRMCSDERFRGYIKHFIEEYSAALVRMKDVDEVFRNLSTDLKAIPYDRLNADEGIINFRNGLLRLSDLTLLPHDPELLSTIQLNCEWSGEDTPAPVFDAYLSRLTDGSTEIQKLLLQFMGAALSNVRGSRYKKALLMCGQGDTGKSQLKILTERLLGRDNFAAIDLPELETQFGASMLYGKRLAGTADMTFMTIRELKMFKTLTGGDHVKVEFKGKTGFSYIYNGLIWFCANRPPKFGGDSGKWVYDRIMLVNCPNVIPLSEQDRELADKMFMEREGIVYRAVMALKETITAGYRFSEPESIAAAREDYRAENDSVIQFIQDCMIERKKPGSIPAGDNATVTMVHRIYVKWCKYNNNGYARTLNEFKSGYAEYLELPMDKAICRRGKGVYLMFHEVSEEAYCNLLPTDTDIHRDLAYGRGA